MAKKPSGFVTFTEKSGKSRITFFATSKADAREVVKRRLKLANFTSRSLDLKKVLHVNWDGHLIPAIDEVTSSLVVSQRPAKIGRPSLKPRKPEKKKHNHHGLRQAVEETGIAA